MFEGSNENHIKFQNKSFKKIRIKQIVINRNETACCNFDILR